MQPRNLFLMKLSCRIYYKLEELGIGRSGTWHRGTQISLSFLFQNTLGHHDSMPTSMKYNENKYKRKPGVKFIIKISFKKFVTKLSVFLPKLGIFFVLLMLKTIFSSNPTENYLENLRFFMQRIVYSTPQIKEYIVKNSTRVFFCKQFLFKQK